MSKWPTISLDEVLRLERRPVKVEPEKLYQEIGIYCFGRGIFHKTPRTGFEVGDKDLFLMKEGDFILQVTFAWEGAIAIVSAVEDGMYGSTRYPTFRVDESRCEPKFLLNYLKTEEGLQQLVKICPGSAGRNRVLSIKRIPEVFVPLPPLAEQRRVVARIEELAAQIKEARTLRQQAAEEAQVLVTRSTEKIFADAGESFSSEPLGSHVKLQGGFAFKSDEYQESGLPIVRIANLENETVHTEGSPCVPENRLDEFRRFILNPGDILVAMTGATTGKLGIVPENCGTWLLNQRIGRFLPKKPEELEPKYVYWLARGVQKHILETAYGGAQPNISPSDIEAMKFPFPHLAEQRRIVAELDALQAEVDALKRLQAETAVELDALLPSILDRAFKGEL